MLFQKLFNPIVKSLYKFSTCLTTFGRFLSEREKTPLAFLKLFYWVSHLFRKKVNVYQIEDLRL